ncbi:SDR family NAD(P)-dependent oxidoreductase [Diaphorobacter aerolatus]|uniref:SDR family NAD(P)-dependent oxidoreductase n=1 Tax=Diaphorobacter aerolatus TaxID=1288495 RepID=A0A7H0GKL8_9BURK|nr:SDR family NAD(P)-dependent oxidoreductase [Diaphorobacter aerolatus]QNP48834.1 SDR family NAD(P)-dependent oxidoreductase [Diaphorobacter aerolatus]
MSKNQHLTILTGGSRGMGLAMGQQLLGEGHVLISIARKTSEALAAAAASEDQLQQWEQDLSNSAEAAARLTTLLNSLTAGDWASVTLINNAGVIPRIAPIGQISADDLQNAMRVGLEAPMALTGAFLAATDGWPGERKVLNISSGLGRRPMGSQAAYCAAKAGLDLFTSCVALEEALKPDGASLCSLAPGVIDTDMQGQLRGANPGDFPDIGSFKALKQDERLSSPAEAAARVLAYLRRADYGENPVADVRDNPIAAMHNTYSNT